MRDATDMMNEAVERVIKTCPIKATADIHHLLRLAAIEAIRLATADFVAELAKDGKS